MEGLAPLLNGFGIALTPLNVAYLLFGCIAGILVGALPGIGPSSGLALLLPLTFGMNPVSALVLLCGLYQGTMYGGRLSSILVNIPGDPASVVTCFEGYPMTKKGKAGTALGLTAISSFIGGLLGMVVLAFFSPSIARFALRFGPPEYFSLMLFAFTAVSILAAESPVKGIVSTVLGLILAMVGADYVSGQVRLNLGFTELLDGIDFIPVAVGLFALGELLEELETGTKMDFPKVSLALRHCLPSREDLRQLPLPTARGSLIGFLVGVLPGAGATIATFMTYAAEKRISKKPERFGTGIVEGLVAPEAANNASVPGAMIPLLTLGIPGSGGTAVLLAGMMMWGLRPGPLLFKESPDLVWGVIASLIIGNFLLLVLNLAAIPAFVALLRAVSPFAIPIITLLCIVGVYAVDYSMFDVWMMILFGLLGYLMRKVKVPVGPLLLALVLGQTTEGSLRQSLMMSQGSFLIFLNRGLSLSLLFMAGAVVILPAVVRTIRKGRSGSPRSSAA